MHRAFQVGPKRPLHPVLAILATLLSFLFGLSLVADLRGPIYLISLMALYLLFGYERVLLRLLIGLIPMSLFVALLALPLGKEGAPYDAGIRLFLFGLSMTPSLSMRPVDLQRCLRSLKVPRGIEMGAFLSLSFVPLMIASVQEIRCALALHKAAGIRLSIKGKARAFFVPLILKMVDHSDLLSLSLASRGLSLTGRSSIYKPVHVGKKDASFALALLSLTLTLGLA